MECQNLNIKIICSTRQRSSRHFRFWFFVINHPFRCVPILFRFWLANFNSRNLLHYHSFGSASLERITQVWASVCRVDLRVASLFKGSQPFSGPGYLRFALKSVAVNLFANSVIMYCSLSTESDPGRPNLCNFLRGKPVLCEVVYFCQIYWIKWF